MLSFKQFITNPISESVKWDYSRGDNYNKNVKGFHIINHRNGQKVGMAKTLNGARKSVDNHDNKYGAYAHTAHPVYNDTLGESNSEIFEDDEGLDEKTAIFRAPRHIGTKRANNVDDGVKARKLNPPSDHDDKHRSDVTTKSWKDNRQTQYKESLDEIFEDTDNYTHPKTKHQASVTKNADGFDVDEPRGVFFHSNKDSAHNYLAKQGYVKE